MQSKITLIGMYEFDNTLFDKLSFPAGIDRDLAISRIINKSEEFELLYSDFDYLKDRIGIWGEIHERTFKKWKEALDIEYEPLHNYDRHELYSDTRQRDYADESNKAYTDNKLRNFEDSQSEASDSHSNTITGSESVSSTDQKVSAYDENNYSDKQKEDASARTNQTGSGDASGNITRNGRSDELNVADGKENNNTSGKSNEVVKHDAHLFGNIGVTTSQQMLRDQLDIVTWNLYEHISDMFIEEFCILVY